MLVAHILLKKVVLGSFTWVSAKTTGLIHLGFSLGFSSFFLLVLYGSAGLLKLLLILFFGFRLAKISQNPIVIWVYGVFLLFANEYFQGTYVTSLIFFL